MPILPPNQQRQSIEGFQSTEGFELPMKRYRWHYALCTSNVSDAIWRK